MRAGFGTWSAAAAAALAVAAWVTVFTGELFDAGRFFSGDTFERGFDFVKGLLGFNTTATPAFLESGEWADKAKLAGETLAMSAAAAGLAALAALALFMFGARNVMMGSLAPYGSVVWKALFS